MFKTRIFRRYISDTFYMTMSQRLPDSNKLHKRWSACRLGKETHGFTDWPHPYDEHNPLPQQFAACISLHPSRPGIQSHWTAKKNLWIYWSWKMTYKLGCVYTGIWDIQPEREAESLSVSLSSIDSFDEWTGCKSWTILLLMSKKIACCKAGKFKKYGKIVKTGVPDNFYQKKSLWNVGALNLLARYIGL